MHRVLLALGLAAVTAACGDAPTAATSSAPRPSAAIVRGETSFRMFRTACNGERVTLAGMTQVAIVQQNGVWVAVLRSEGQGAGQSHSYTISWLRTMQFVQGAATHESATELLRLRGNGAPDTFIRGHSSITVNPDGTIVSELDFSDESCHG